LLEPLSRDVELEELLLLDVRDLDQDLDALALRLDHVELTLEHRNELGPVFGALGDALEPPQGRQVPAVELEDLAVHRTRLVQVVELRLVQAGDLELVARDLLRLPERLHLAGEDFDELRVFPTLLVDAL